MSLAMTQQCQWSVCVLCDKKAALFNWGIERQENVTRMGPRVATVVLEDLPGHDHHWTIGIYRLHQERWAWRSCLQMSSCRFA
jgi:hypothetical protein